MAGSTANMHYDFKTKLNRLDGNFNRELKIPEIDRKLNEAITIFILITAEPKFKKFFGIETSESNFEDIRPLVVNEAETQISGNVVQFPSDYMFYLNSYAIGKKDNCTAKFDTVYSQYDDRTPTSEFYKTDFDWRELVIRFSKDGIKLYNDDIEIISFYLSYIKKHPYIHYAEGFNAGGYKLPSGETLTGTVNPILPEHTLSRVVDIAVLLATSDLGLVNMFKLKEGIINTEQIIN